MFIRKTRTGSSSSGEIYFTYRLVRSKRQGDKVRQITLLNLGRHFAIEAEDWPVLCSRIEDILKGQTSLLTAQIPEVVEREAHRIAAQLLTRQGEDMPKERAPSDIQSVDVNTLALIRPRSVGVEHIGLWAMAQVGFSRILSEAGLNGAQRAAVMGLIIGRMARPGSERSTHGWLQGLSSLGELLDFDYEKMHLMQLYRASDLLMQHRKRIEKQLFSRVRDLFGFSCTVTLYDLTNTYFEGEVGENSRAKRGHSKERRSDCPLLTLGLVLDGSGFVKRSQVFSGNAKEAATLQEMLKGLEAPFGALVVMDRGIATEANVTWLKEQGYRYLVVSRRQHRQFDSDEVRTLTTASGDTLKVQKVLAEDEKEVFLYCYSQQRAEKEEGMTRRFTERFEASLRKMSEGLSRPRTVKKIERIHERIGRLLAESHGIGQHYEIKVMPDETGKKARDIQWVKRPRAGTMMTHPGVYCLRSSETDWDEKRLWRTYIMLTDLEGVFRCLKSELGLRPIYHQKESRSEGHLFITVLAYQLVQVIRRRLRSYGIHDSWQTLRFIFSVQQRVTVTFRRTDGRTLNVRKATQPEVKLRNIYEALGLPMNPGGIKKLVV